jgi:hypothetical protein
MDFLTLKEISGKSICSQLLVVNARAGCYGGSNYELSGPGCPKTAAIIDDPVGTSEHPPGRRFKFGECFCK